MLMCKLTYWHCLCDLHKENGGKVSYSEIILHTNKKDNVGSEHEQNAILKVGLWLKSVFYV
jgi:hypothetical protein